MNTNHRDSHSHPFEIEAVRVSPKHGRIGITFCPGKQQAASITASWARDIDIDPDAVENWGAAALVMIIEDHEIVSLGVLSLNGAVSRRNMSWYHLPIPDLAAPDAAFVKLLLTRGVSQESNYV